MADNATTPLIETRGLVKKFGSFTALNGVDLTVYPGEVHALLGDNGAGKSTLIKILSGVFKPTDGEIIVEGRPVSFASPRDATNAGIGTVYQDLALNALTSVTRNFFLGREITHFSSPFGLLKMGEMDRIATEEMAKIGINVADPNQPVGTMSGGQRQTPCHRPGNLFWREGADPRRADFGARPETADGSAENHPQGTETWRYRHHSHYT